MRECENTRLASLVAPRMAAIRGRELDESDRALLIRAMESLKSRAKNLSELAEGAVFLFKNRPLDLDEKHASLLDDAARALLGKPGRHCRMCRRGSRRQWAKKCAEIGGAAGWERVGQYGEIEGVAGRVK